MRKIRVLRLWAVVWAVDVSPRSTVSVDPCPQERVGGSCCMVWGGWCCLAERGS